ncbi:hypothetical protein MY535_08745 [Haemophilus influenzae]|nr:hypothetical protein [Haemophilus influenzae]
MRQFVIVVLYSAILLSLEVIYRKLFNISSIERYTESYLSVCLSVCLFVFSKYRITRILVGALFAISIVVNNVHYAVYQSWIGPVNYSLAFKEINEITNAGLTMIDKFIYPLLFGLFEVAVFLSLSFIKEKYINFLGF